MPRIFISYRRTLTIAGSIGLLLIMTFLLLAGNEKIRFSEQNIEGTANARLIPTTIAFLPNHNTESSFRQNISQVSTPTAQNITPNALMALVQAERNLNVRSGPGENFTTLGTVTRGTVVRVLETDARGWLRIQSETGLEGWVSQELIRVIGTATPVGTSTPTATATASPTGTLTADLYRTIGRDLYNDSRFLEAIENLSAAIELAPDDALSYLYRGEAYSLLGFYQESDPQLYALALEDFNRALELDANLGDAYVGRADIARRAGNLAEAEADYNKALEINPDSAHALRGLGVLYSAQGDNEAALDAYDRAIALDSAHADQLYNNRGVIYYDRGDYEKAVAEYNEALGIDPFYALAYMNRAYAYFHMGEHELALADFNRAVDLLSETILPLLHRGDFYSQNLGEFELAIADYNHVLAINPDSFGALVGRGDVYFRSDELQLAMQDFMAALEIAPDDSYPYLYLGHIYYEMGNYADSLSSYQRYIQLAGDNPSFQAENRVKQLLTATPTPS